MKQNNVRLAGWERWLLNTGAALGLLCLVLAGLALVLGMKPLIVVSGSMSPSIPVGSLALAVATPAADIAPGQVVSVVSFSGNRITHRVVSADPVTGLVLKGDANPVSDLQPYTVVSVDRVVFSVPFLGYVTGWLSSPLVFGLGGLVCAYLLYLAFFRPNAGKPDGSSSDSDPAAGGSRQRAQGRKWRGAGAIIAALAVVIPLGIVNRVEATQAAWTASAVANATIGSVKLDAPGGLTCTQVTGDPFSVKLVWIPPAMPPSGYVVRLWDNANPGAVTESQSQTGTSYTLSLDSAQGVLGVLLGILDSYDKVLTVQVIAKYPHGWDSAPASRTTIHAKKDLLYPLVGTKYLSCS
ncbi:signal peptidase, endoplasmic reticulum-type [Arthrobacter alpinus]|uniref:Signal peptidase I n=1 Tax=Arthrobacter alpinus TaxID=656366 RepID=A0A1H5KH17_9MICC|nr:signal peptidase I [Arthrobacter alpinus]SEE63268.1 signal peptidase, endoplasmic reticulum-type [Arthrobacter alpinus]